MVIDAAGAGFDRHMLQVCFDQDGAPKRTRTVLCQVSDEKKK